MTEKEAQAYRDRAEARARAVAKFGDGSAVIDEDDLKVMDGNEIRGAANAGRLVHLGIGPDSRLRHR